MVQAAIRDQVGLSARNLAINDSGNINTCLAHKITPQFNDQRGEWEVLSGSGDEMA